MPLLIVGVGHVFRIDASIRNLIERYRPNVVALELDPARYHGLLQRAAGRTEMRVPEGSPRVYRWLARFQEDVAGSLGAEVGGEMLAGAQAAQAVGSQLALIDRSAEESVHRLWTQMRWREKLRLFGSLLAAKLSFRKGPSVEDEIARYEKDPEAFLRQVAEAYPTITRVLIDERNEFMAGKLRDLVRDDRRVVALVGDGHVNGLVDLLRGLEPKTVRLADLRKGIPELLQWRTGPGGASVGFSFDQESLEGNLRRGP